MIIIPTRTALKFERNTVTNIAFHVFNRHSTHSKRERKKRKTEMRNSKTEKPPKKIREMTVWILAREPGGNQRKLAVGFVPPALQ